MKQELRRLMKQKLADLRETLYLPVGIVKPILPLDTGTLFAFMSFNNEIDTTPIIEYALAQGLTIALPRVAGDALVFHTITDLAHNSAKTQLVSGAYGIREPHENRPVLFAPATSGIPETVTLQFPLVILVPGLAFSRDGARLGRGKGYYDRFLHEILARHPDERTHITLAGVCHHFQILDTIPTDAHDIAVDCLISGDGCILHRGEIVWQK